MDLLHTTALVQLDKFDLKRIAEISHMRIVERNMSILSYTKHANVKRHFLKQLRVARGFGVNVGSAAVYKIDTAERQQ